MAMLAFEPLVTAVDAAPHLELVPPAPPEALATVLPEWLANAPEWLTPLLKDVAVAVPSMHPSQQIPAEVILRFVALAMRGTWTEDSAIQEEERKQRVRVFEEEVAEERRQRANRPQQVSDERVAVIRFGSLDRAARRRAQRWIARQPVGPEYPVIRLRTGRRSRPEQADADFLDVARPEISYQNDPAMGWAATVFEDFRWAVGRTRGACYPSIGAYMMLCSHQGTYSDGGRTFLHVGADGRALAVV